jgi:hypothetical protein
MVLDIVWNTRGGLGHGPMILFKCVGRRIYSYFRGQLSLFSLGMLVVLVTESFLSMEERWTVTKAHARTIVSSFILTFSLENLFIDLPCVLCLYHCVPVH